MTDRGSSDTAAISRKVYLSSGRQAAGSWLFILERRSADSPRMEPHPPHESRAVLVLEDDEAVRGVFARVLRQHGYTPVLAGSVDEAIAAASTNDLSAVTVDISLGRGPTGLDFLCWLRRAPAYSTTPAMILTGSPVLPPGAADRAHDLGARVFFKPQPYSILLEHLAAEVAGSGSNISP